MEICHLYLNLDPSPGVSEAALAMRIAEVALQFGLAIVVKHNDIEMVAYPGEEATTILDRFAKEKTFSQRK